MSDSHREKTLYLVDAMSLAYRAHFIFISRPLINSKGQNTSASYGFTNSLLKLINDEEIDHIAVVFDAANEEGTFREDIYEDYKAHRDPPPDDLLENLPYIKKIVRAMDIPVLEMDGVEADDVIGTLAKRAAKDSASVRIVSPDKDFQQLLDDHITMYKPSRGDEDFEIITADSFREEMGFDPEHFKDMLALWGDSSDNIPGVPLIGEKTSAKLLREYGTMEDVIEHAEDVGGKRGQNLKEYADQARMSKRLVEIKTDLDVDFDWTELRRNENDKQALVALFDELEFDSLLDRFEFNGDVREKSEESDSGSSQKGDSQVSFDFGPYEEVIAFDEEEVEYHIVQNEKQLQDVVDELQAVDRLAIDTETTSTNPMMASLVGISMCWNEGEAVYIPTPLPGGAQTDTVLDALRPVLQDAALIGHNLKYDLTVLERHGLLLNGDLFDTMVANYLIDPEGQHSLGKVSRKFLNYRMQPIEELIGSGKNQKSMRDVAVEKVGPYACEDADIAWRLADKLQSVLEEHKLWEIAETMEFPLVRVLSRMEQNGIRIDEEMLKEISDRLAGEMEELEEEIFDLAGEEFNVNSTQQLGKVLFDKLGLPVKAKTSTGKPSTKESVLQELSEEHDLPELVLEWRSKAKLKNTYLDSLGELIHPETGRIHTNFNQTRTATGRLSSSSPNLQNIPVRTAIGREIRRAFVPEEGWTLMAADYAQIELRILASMSGDEAMIETFKDGGDIHTDAAARVYDIDPDDVTRDQRRKAKEVNYGIPYGVSAWGLSQRLQTSVDEAQELIDQYRKSYSGVARFLSKLVDKARENGYAETLLGRRRYVRDIDSSNSNQRSAAERIAVNMPIQGTQADMIKLAMRDIHQELLEGDFSGRMLLQVHDELVFEAPPEEIEQLEEVVRSKMAEALTLDVPIRIEIDTGPNWLEAH